MRMAVQVIGLLKARREAAMLSLARGKDFQGG